jgi:hypothetical protein
VDVECLTVAAQVTLATATERIKSSLKAELAFGAKSVRRLLSITEGCRATGGVSDHGPEVMNSLFDMFAPFANFRIRRRPSTRSTLTCLVLE